MQVCALLTAHLFQYLCIPEYFKLMYKVNGHLKFMLLDRAQTCYVLENSLELSIFLPVPVEC